MITEIAIGHSLSPRVWDKTFWMLRDPYRGEGFDRVIGRRKAQSSFEVQPGDNSVGDSSGFFSLQPTIINRYTNGKRM